jgi:hypothetical protein
VAIQVAVNRVRDIYERSPDQVELTPELLESALFGDQPAVFAHVAVVEGEVAGFALWFLSFSTWLGRHTIAIRPWPRADARGAAA